MVRPSAFDGRINHNLMQHADISTAVAAGSHPKAGGPIANLRPVVAAAAAVVRKTQP